MTGVLLKAEFRGGGTGLIYREPGHRDFAVIPHSSGQSSHLHIGPAATVVRIIGRAEMDNSVSDALRASMLAYEALEVLVPQMEEELGGQQMCPGLVAASSRLGKPLASLLAQSQGS
jgi:hypothetical protein